MTGNPRFFAHSYVPSGVPQHRTCGVCGIGANASIHRSGVDARPVCDVCQERPADVRQHSVFMCGLCAWDRLQERLWSEAEEDAGPDGLELDGFVWGGFGPIVGLVPGARMAP